LLRRRRIHAGFAAELTHVFNVKAVLRRPIQLFSQRRGGISEPGSLGARLDSQFTDVRAARTMLLTFGALSLGLSMIGLYAALAFVVGERTREIAVRLALGASRADVGGLVFRRGMAIVSLGIAAGIVACVLAGPFLAHLLYGVSPRDPLAIAAGPAMLIVVAALAISLQARRAMQQNPIVALRAE
jgi:ABC-type antimicrobial peptide transport system permease subunit